MFRFRGKFYILKAPWLKPMFSERYGKDRVFPLGKRGWRLVIRKVGG